MKMTKGDYIPIKIINRKIHDKLLQNRARWCAIVLLPNSAHRLVPQVLL